MPAPCIKKAAEYAEELVPSFNVLLYFRLGYWLARGFLRFLYWVKVGYNAEKQYDNIDPNSCIVIVSNHRSNFDPFFLIYLPHAEQRSLTLPANGPGAFRSNNCFMLSVFTLSVVTVAVLCTVKCWSATFRWR